MMALDIQRAPAVHVLCEYSICVKISVSHLKALLLISLSCSNVIFSNSWCFFTLLVALKRRLSKYYESLTVNKKAITSRHQFVIFFFFFHFIQFWRKKEKIFKSTSKWRPLMICNGRHAQTHLDCRSSRPLFMSSLHHSSEGFSAASLCLAI